MKEIVKRDGKKEPFEGQKVITAVNKAFKSCGMEECPEGLKKKIFSNIEGCSSVEEIQDTIEETLADNGFFKVAKAYILYRENHKNIRNLSKSKASFINKYKKAFNTADVSIDDNANVASKNIGILNNELYKDLNIEVNRYRVVSKLRELYPSFDAKQYLRDLENHIIYKNDENSTFGFPYCVAISMYPFLKDGLRGIDGLSTAPKSIHSFCGGFINMVFTIASQYAGAVATPEFLLCFDYFARKEFGDDYHLRLEEKYSEKRSIKEQIYQFFQSVTYSINQPIGARGCQSVFWNIAIFDKPFYDSMFEDFRFPDNSQSQWESFNALQKMFLSWLNDERLKCILTFPVVSVSLLYKDGKFVDKDMKNFASQELAKGNSFFIYISDTVDSLSSCCRLKNKISSREFNYTNGNMSVMTGSKSVITLNMNRITQLWAKEREKKPMTEQDWVSFREYISGILERVYKYHTAYNELLWDLYNANLLPVYKANFVTLNKQYLTVGINGFTAAAEFLGIPVKDCEEYKDFCRNVFSVIKENNESHKTVKTMYNCEQIPAESAGIKLYNYDKEDGFWVPEDINLYTSYMFKPYDTEMSVLEKMRLHGNDYIGDWLDGGASCHINLEEHLSKRQYGKLIDYAAKVGCQYFTFNVPNCQCEDCGYIAKRPFDKCPACGSSNVSLWDRVVGFLTKIRNWSEGRRIEWKTRFRSKKDEVR